MKMNLTNNQRKIKNIILFLILAGLITLILFQQAEIYNYKHQSECASQEMIQQCINRNNKE
jgi:hypothetical protein